MTCGLICVSRGILAGTLMGGLGERSGRAAIVVVMVLLAQLLWRRRLSPTWRCALWSLALVPLLAPALPASRFSLLNLGQVLEHRAASIAIAPAAPMISESAVGGVVTTFGYLPAEPLARPQVSVGRAADPSRRVPIGVTIAWALGVAALGIRLVLANMALWRRVAAGQQITGGPHFDLLAECCREMNIGHPPRLVLSDAVSVPALAGAVSPRILLPPAVAALPPHALRLVFLHELCHLKRHDLGIDWLCTLLNILHWFNPLLWLAASRYRADRELARDAMVLRVAGAQESHGYGLTLLRLVAAINHAGRRPLLAPILSSRARLRERIAMIARFDSRRRQFSIVGPCLVLAVGCATLTQPKPTVKVSVSAAPPMVTAPASSPAESSAEIEARAALKRGVPEISFNGVPFGDAIEQLRAATGANLSADWRELNRVGVTRESPVTGRFRSITLDKLLRSILSDVTGGNQPLAYRLDGGTIEITTRDAVRLATTVTRLYDVHDLLVEIPDFDQVPSMSLPSSTTRPSAPPEKPQSREQRVQAIIALIQQTIDPDSWTNGGVIKEASPGTFAIRQSPENHAAIEQLLWQLRETRALQITVETRFVVLGKSARQHFGLNAAAGKANPGRGSGAYLTDAQVNELFKPSPPEAGVSVVTSPRLTLFNGQRGWLMISTQRAYISGYNITGTPPKFEPQIDVANSGVLVDAQATISSDRKYVTLTLRPQITRLERLDTLPWRDAPANQPLTIQRPIVSVRQIQTTVSIPDQQTLILGGFEDSIIGGTTPRPATQPATAPSFLEQLMAPPREDAELFLFVRPRIIIQRQTTRPAGAAPA